MTEHHHAKSPDIRLRNPEPTEADAREIFKRAFKAKYPKGRINGKLARQLWEERKDAAMDVARRNYSAAREHYESREREIAERNTAAAAQYRDAVKRIEEFRQAVAAVVHEKQCRASPGTIACDRDRRAERGSVQPYGLGRKTARMQPVSFFSRTALDRHLPWQTQRSLES